jgi:hypothetical protein
MCKNEHFQNLGMENELFKIQGRKTKLMYNLKMKTIFWPCFYLASEEGSQKAKALLVPIVLCGPICATPVGVHVADMQVKDNLGSHAQRFS